MSFAKPALQAIAPHGPDAVIPFVLFVGAMGGLCAGVNALAVVAITAICAVMYFGLAVRKENHKERMAEIEIRKIETTRLLTIQAKLAAAKAVKTTAVPKKPKAKEGDPK